MLPRIIAFAAPIVVLAWIALIAASIPLALSLDEVLEVVGRASLPETAESVKALRELKELGGGSPLAGAKAILVVEDLSDPLSPDDYWALKDDYASFKEEYGAYSWLDIADSVVREVEAGVRELVNTAYEVFALADQLWNGYNQALVNLEDIASKLEDLATLLAFADRGYVAAYSGLNQLSSQAPQLYDAGEPLEKLCVEAIPAFAKLYIDVVRVEGLLEYHTDAFEKGLSESDVAFVTLATNLPQAGLESVSPQFVAAVYNLVVALGGPEAFNNATAAFVTAEIAKAGGAGGEIDFIAEVWARIVSEAPSLKSFLQQGVVEGQVAIARAVRDEITPVAAKTAASIAAKEIVERAPLEARRLVSLYLEALIDEGCSPDARKAALTRALTEYLETLGYPRELALEAAKAAAEGNEALLKEVAALIASTKVVEEAGIEGLEPEVLAGVLVEYDPEASGAITTSSFVARAAAGELLSSAFGAPEEVVRAVAEGRAEEVAAKLTVEAAVERGAPRDLVEELLDPPPGSREEVLERASKVLARALEERGVEDADDVANEVLKAYVEGDSREEATARVFEVLGNKVLETLLSRLEGVLVEPGRRGFIVALTEVESYDEVVGAKGDLENLLEKVGGSKILATGGLAFEAEAREAAVEDLRRSDMVSSVLVLTILAAVLGTIVGIFLPFVGIGAGLIVASAIVYLLASRDYVTVIDMSRALMISTGLGLGIDYAAYVSRRFREGLRGSRGPAEAAEEAIRKSWRPVMAGAFAAAAGFGSLTLAEGFPFARSIGSVVPISILLVMAASLTLTPAILAIIGDRRLVWWPSCPYKVYEAGSGIATAVTRITTFVAPLTVIAVLAVAGASLVYLSGFQGSFDVRVFVPSGSEAYEALDTILEGYEPGAIFPMFVVASSEESAERLAPALEALECVANASVDGRLITLELAVNPLGDEGVECALEVREKAHSIDPGSLVGGPPSENLDLRDALYREFYGKVLPAAAIVIFLVMLAFYMSLPAALSAVVTIGASAAMGIAAAAVVSEALGFRPPWFLPVVVTAALLGVGMDYNSFYLNSLREAAFSGAASREYVMEAAKRGAALVVGLSMIMAGAYAGLSISSIEAIKVASLGLTLGVLLAGINSALLLTPAAARLMGAAFWWPYTVLRRGWARGKTS